MLHPFKTIRTLLRERDYSQMVLVFGLPLYLLFGGLGLIWFARRLVQAPPGVWGFYTKGGVLGVFLIAAFLFFYIGYWLGQVLKVKRKNQ